MRTFTTSHARRDRVPLLIGITGPSSSGKTYSALRLGSGIARFNGGPLYVIDTEHGRSLHYAPAEGQPVGPGTFDFEYVALPPPFGPLDYLSAIEHCMRSKPGCIVIDSMTHEHSGTGGVLDQSECYLRDRLGDDAEKPGPRGKHLATSLIKPKRERKALNNAIVQMGVTAIFCYRAQDKIKPIPGKEPEKLGWQAETTSPLTYEMTVRFLLLPSSDGKPTLMPPNEAERLATKTPAQFRDWFTPGFQLTEELGEKLAQWAAGGVSPEEALAARVAAATTPAELEALVPELKSARVDKPARDRLRAAYGARQTALTSPARETGDD